MLVDDMPDGGINMGKRKVKTGDLKPGMISANDVYTFNDQLIIQEGTQLTERIITRLKFYAVTEIAIESDEDDIIPDYVDLTPVIFSYDKPYREQVMATPEFKRFHASYTSALENISESLNDIAMGKRSPVQDELLDVTGSVLKHVRNNLHLFDMLNCMYDSSDIIYTHSLNVALTARALGIWLGLSDADLDVLTCAGLLHDIGKLLVPQEILNKPGSLTPQEYSIVKNHATFGYNLLKDQANLDPRIKRAVLMHHERCDGSGYPVGLHRTAIDDFARILGIADVYDAMSSKRSYREAYCPFAIMDMFERDGLEKYDPEYILTFRTGVVETYLHNNVVLNDGREGEVVLINKLSLSRPVIRLKDNTYVNLEKKHELYIKKVI